MATVQIGIAMQDIRDPDTTHETSVPDAVRQKFSDRLDAVERLVNNSEEFREICRDYHDGVVQLAGLSEKHVENDPCVVDYRTVLAELEGEILAHLALIRS